MSDAARRAGGLGFEDQAGQSLRGGGGYSPGLAMPPVGAPGPVPALSAGGVGLPPWYVPPENALDFNINGFANINGAVVTTFQRIATGSVPNGSQGVIRSVSLIAVGAITAATRVAFRVATGRSGVQGWSEVFLIAVPATSSGVLYGPEETFIRLPQGTTDFGIDARIDDGATYDIQCQGHGWTWGG